MRFNASGEQTPQNRILKFTFLLLCILYSLFEIVLQHLRQAMNEHGRLMHVGGAIYRSAPNGTADIGNCVFDRNSAKTGGGAIWEQAGHFDHSSPLTSFKWNNALKTWFV